MSWYAVGVAAAGVVVNYMGAKSAESQASGARGDAKNFQSQQLAIENEKLQMAKDQQAKWDEMYGPIEENLSSFYRNLTPEQLVSTGLQKQAEAYSKTKQNMQRTAAQRGIDSPALTEMETNLELENARNKAEIRAEAPLKVASAQAGFIQGNSAPIGQTLQQMNQFSGVLGDRANQYMNQANQFNQQSQQGWAGVGQAIGTGANLYAYNQRTKALNQNYDYGGTNYPIRPAQSQTPAQNYYAPPTSGDGYNLMPDLYKEN